MYETFDTLLEELKKKYDSECKYNETLQKKLREYNKDEEISKRDDLIRELRNNSLLIMSNKEREAQQNFIKRHYELHNGGKFKAVGNTYIYSLTGTGLGTIITIKCPICGEKTDITDTTTW